MEELARQILFVGESQEFFEDVIGLLRELGPFETTVVGSSQDAILALETFQPCLIISKLHGPQLSWKDLLAEARKASVPIPVIFTDCHEWIDEAIEAIREGADDFIAQPSDPKNVLLRIQTALGSRQLHAQLRDLQRELRFRRNADYIIGTSAKIQAVLGKIIKVAESDIAVLISGESGTGKELVARAIHYNSRRAGRPFISVNCAAIPEPLLENELFGHVKGSYTDADRTTRGLYEEANGGSLFLDEIGELGAAVQTKLLKVLERGEFRRVGGTETIKTHVRLIAATNKDLKEAVASGQFREDLYYRINVFPIEIPPLRERKEDLCQFVNHFFRLHQGDLKKRLDGFSPSAIQKLMFYNWPGNVRELENKVRQAMINAVGPLIYREDIVFEDRKDSPSLKSFKEAKQEFERNYTMNVLRIAQGNVAEAARLAKKDRKDFYDVMRKYKLRSQDFRIP